MCAYLLTLQRLDYLQSFRQVRAGGACARGMCGGAGVVGSCGCDAAVGRQEAAGAASTAAASTLQGTQFPFSLHLEERPL